MIITTHYPSINGGVGHGLLKRRYSVPEIIMRKHTLAQQKTYEESVAATAPISIPTRKSSSYTTTTTKTSTARTTGSDSNLSRTPYSPSNLYGSKNTARKSSLLRHLFNKELKKHEASIRSESNSPSIRRHQRRLYHRGSGESVECVECQKLNLSRSSDISSIIAESKRPKLTHSTASLGTTDDGGVQESIITATAAYLTTTPSNVEESTTPVSQAPTTHESLDESSGSVDSAKRSVLIYMTSLEKSEEDEDSGQDMLRVEIQEQNYESPEPNLQQQVVAEIDTNRNDFMSESLSDENANEVKCVENTTTEELTHFYKSALGRIKFYRDEDENVYISKILVDNLNNIADTVNDRLIIDGQKYFDQLDAENNEPKNEIRVIRAKQIIKEGSTTSQSPASVSKDSTRSIELNSKMQVIETELGLSAVQINDIINIQTIHYFPDYYADNRGDLSSHTSHSSDPDGVELVTVNTGSTYPLRGVHEAIILSRLSAYPRTQSMEVQPPSTSPREDEDVGNVSDVSLVDSLDDPVSPAVKVFQRIYKSPESFFVPIVDPMQQIDEHLDVADAMPDSLRRRLYNRQKRLAAKEKKARNKDVTAAEEAENKAKIAGKKWEKPPSVPRKVITKARKLPAGTKKSQLQNELGMLESYKIDSRGNMQIQTQAKKEHVTNSEKTIKPTRKPVVKKPIKTKPMEHQSFKKLPPEKKEAKPMQVINKGTEKLTFYPPADLTPDKEGGPKRMYQKTEIKQDGKTIEILEIVECPPENYESGDDSTSHDLSEGKTGKTKSKIPIPVIKPIDRTEKIADYSPDNSPPAMASGKSSFKIDKKIAGLLIEALQSPEEMGVEFIKSPKDSKKPYSQRQTQGGCSFYIPAPKPRSVNSNRYLQKFDVIPEERTSFSIDSSADEVSLPKRRNSRTPVVIEVEEEDEASAPNDEEPARESTPEPEVSIDKLEEAIEQAQEKSFEVHTPVPTRSAEKSDETLVWTDVFKQHGNGNPLESANDLEGWSVTVAGNYNPEMAPDVDLKLSFPKPGQKQSMVVNNNNSHANGQQNPQQNGNHGNEYYSNHPNENRLQPQQVEFEEEDEDYYVGRKQHPSLPAPPVQQLPDNYNPRRTLSRSENRAPQTAGNVLQQRNCHLPGVNGHSSTINTSHVTRQTAKKAIKRVECTVTSATTRTISNMPRNRIIAPNGPQRAMSFQALNQMNGGTSKQPMRQNGNRGVLQRDRSLDVRYSNSNHQRRMSLDEGQTSRTASNGSEMLSTLSVMGNSIAPELKPKVPTMSERDLTGRHNSCFTRTRPFLS